MIRPNYHGGSIVNLTAAVIHSCGGDPTPYLPLKGLDTSLLRRANNLVLLVIDGLGYAYLTQSGAQSTLRDHLKAKMTSVFPPTTATAITTFLTGQAPQEHGLTGWYTYFREIGSPIAVLPFRARFGGPPLSEAGISAQTLFNHVPLFDRIDVPSYIITPEWITHSAFNAAHKGKANNVPYASINQCFKHIVELVNNRESRKYIYAYWPGFDHLAHEKGISHRTVANHFTEIDKLFAQLLVAVKGTNTVIMATSDHGFIDSGSDHCIDINQHPELKQALILPLCGERRLAYCYVKSGRETQFENYVQSELAGVADIVRSTDLIEQGFFGLGPPHPQLAQRVGDYTLVMKPKKTMVDWVEGEEHFIQMASHGGVTADEMYVPLIFVHA